MKYINNMVLFWGWKDPFSNFFSLQNPIVLNNVSFPTSEHLFMWMKATYFEDFETADLITRTKFPADAKKLGKLIRDFDSTKWAEIKVQAMELAVFMKFSIDPWLKNMLLSTNEMVLVEASPIDLDWGVGFSEDDDRILDPNNWTGKNLLGEVLMSVRKELK